MERMPVWIVDSDHWPRAYLRAELIERGYDAEGFVRVPDLRGSLSFAIGGSTEAEDERGRPRGWAKFLQRPLTLGEIADEVERLLAKPGR